MKKIDTKKWIENFNLELTHIQIEFDAFFVEGKPDDYYDLNIDKKMGLVTIHISKLNELPKQISDAITDAFMKSKP